jgi:prolyl 4-hydroxylase
MARTELPQEWKDWVAHNVARGCSITDLYNTLVREGFAPQAAERELNLRTVALKRLPSERIELYTAEQFLLPKECQELIEIIKRSLRPSTISHDGTAEASFRTSRTCDLVGGEPEVRALDQKICGAMGLAPALAEPSQGQYYEITQEFKPHTDYFEAYELERNSTPTLGQRTWTFMVYLNDVDAGGETAFVNAGLVIPPRQGTALLWNNLRADGSGNYDTLHHGMPVKAGYKAIITKWFRRPR